MEDGARGYFNKIFNRPVGIISGGWQHKRKQKSGDDKMEETAKEEFISRFEEDAEVKEIVNEFERNMITKVLKLYDLKAKDVMIPRTSVFAIDINDEITEILDEIIQERYSRIPVYDKDIDNVIGVMHVKDIFAQIRKGNVEQINLRGILRDAMFVSEHKALDKLLIEMQRDRVHMACVINEYGGFVGALTIEDIIEEIVGDIKDEDDEQEVSLDIQKISDTTYKIDGLTSISRINEELNIDIPEDITETIGALLLGELGKLPIKDKDKSSAFIGEIELKAVKVSDRRIATLLLKLKK